MSGLRQNLRYFLLHVVKPFAKDSRIIASEAIGLGHAYDLANVGVADDKDGGFGPDGYFGQRLG